MRAPSERRAIYVKLGFSLLLSRVRTHAAAARSSDKNVPTETPGLTASPVVRQPIDRPTRRPLFGSLATVVADTGLRDFGEADNNFGAGRHWLTKRKSGVARRFLRFGRRRPGAVALLFVLLLAIMTAVSDPSSAHALNSLHDNWEGQPQVERRNGR